MQTARVFVNLRDESRRAASSPRIYRISTNYGGIEMKMNWTMLKGVLAVIVIVGAVLWAVDSLRTSTYSGADLSFAVGDGMVALTNPSDQAIPVQLNSTRNFTVVASTIEGVSGASTRQGTGSSLANLFEFALPPGESEFRVTRSSGTTGVVTFVAASAENLMATTQPLNDLNYRATLIAMAVVIVAALYFLSSLSEHRWFYALRGKTAPLPQPLVSPPVGGQGESIRAYGDNRADRSHDQT
jgi:hypothetical protein